MPQNDGFEGTGNGPKVFISYTRSEANSFRVDCLYQFLVSAGFRVWVDKVANPSGFWSTKVEEAIQSADFFVPCFCRASQKRFEEGDDSHQIRECGKALVRQASRPSNRDFILICRFENVKIPVLIRDDISLHDVNYYDLFTDHWKDQLDKLVSAMGGPSPSRPTEILERHSEVPIDDPSKPTSGRFKEALDKMGIFDGTVSLKEPEQYDRFTCLRNATQRFNFMGAFGTKWLREGTPLQNSLRRFENVRRQNNTQPKVQFLLGNPFSRGMTEVREQWVDREPNRFLEEPEGYLEKWRELRERYHDVLEVKFYNHRPNFRLTFIDVELLIFSYYIIDRDGGFGSKTGWDLPQLICRRAGDYRLISAFETYFYQVWNTATPLDMVIKFNNNRVWKSDASFEPKVIHASSRRSLRCVGNIPSSKTLIGRDNDLATLRRELESTSTSPLVISSGFGGVGKSSAAAEIVYGYERHGGPFGLIVWIDLQTYLGKAKTFGGIIEHAVQLCADEAEDDQLNAQTLTSYWRSRNTLVVFDNYETMIPHGDTMSKALEEEKSLRRFISKLPRGGFDENGCIRALVTTRKNVFTPGNTKVIDMKALCPEDSVELISNICRDNDLIGILTDNQKQLIAERLEGLPKYMEFVMGSLSGGTFNDLIASIEAGVGVGEEIFDDIIGITWKHLSDSQKIVLVSACLFQGAAPGDALLRISELERREYLKAIQSMRINFLQPNGDRYFMHALVREFLELQLSLPEWEDLLGSRKSSFVQYYKDIILNIPPNGEIRAHTEYLQEHLDNIEAAVQYAFEQGNWESVIAFYSDELRNVLEYIGRWVLWLSIMEKIVVAADRINNKELAAKCRIYNVTWVHLRHERLDEARRYASKGLELYKKLDDEKGIAQAIRHLGKIELLKGEYDDIYGKEESPLHFRNAEKHYKEATKIFEDSRLEEKALKLANMRLDFGRLYWLQGRKLPTEEALALFDKSQAESLRARDDFRKIGKVAGEAKALGNLGNTTKQIAIFRWGLSEAGPNDLSETDKTMAKRTLLDAGRFYRDSLKLAEKRAEIAHANWGLAEIYELLATMAPNEIQKHADISLALIYARKSHHDYKALGGGRDIEVTGELEERLESKLQHANSTREIDPDDFYCLNVLSGREPVDIVRETSRVLAFHHTRPSFPVHIMVVPRQHVHSILEATEEALICEMMAVVQEIMAETKKNFGGCRLTTNIGSCRNTPHLHWHIYTGSPEMIVDV